MKNNLKNIGCSFNNGQPSKTIDYEAVYRKFLVKLDRVANFEPKSKYLYAVMDGVPFQDMNNALDIAIENKPD